MPARFTTLNNAISKGLSSMAAKSAVSQIEYWEEQLKDVDVTGVKGIQGDLHSLKSKLTANDIDGEAVKKVLASLAEKTKNISGRVEDEKVSEQLAGVAEGLEQA
ncbi:hypothetical protein [Devosia rhizoryzae]|uniref:Uncharacterized protein n=1 Tax=Devosia rhizoryzae TaxID=2774137 RepID=A0ABX7C9S5_9HYPH|nr:hypothetical protein [Devosia rhizoryzae]QQR40528.1 hypothetical protein JI748_05885 [Devosia rhizoryzae]